MSLYNELMPYMEKIPNTDAHSNNVEGTGYYVEAYNNCYIDLDCCCYIGNDKFVAKISLKRHRSKCAHDILNDELITTTKEDNVKKIVEIVKTFIQTSRGIGKEYTVHLTQNEIYDILTNKNNNTLNDKLRKALSEQN